MTGIAWEQPASLLDPQRQFHISETKAFLFVIMTKAFLFVNMTQAQTNMHTNLVRLMCWRC